MEGPREKQLPSSQNTEKATGTQTQLLVLRQSSAPTAALGETVSESKKGLCSKTITIIKLK